MKRMVKKYPSFKEDFIPFIQSLQQTPNRAYLSAKTATKFVLLFLPKVRANQAVQE
jgi:hypothetical protein